MIDVRWKQRFENFEKAFKKLEEAVDKIHLNELERNGLIQRFEFTLDLAWKTMKDFLEQEGFQFKPSPKETIRQAVKAAYINQNQAQDIIDAIDLRNELSHHYNEEDFEVGEDKIRAVYFDRIKEVYQFFLTILKGENQ